MTLRLSRRYACSRRWFQYKLIVHHGPIDKHPSRYLLKYWEISSRELGLSTKNLGDTVERQSSGTDPECLSPAGVVLQVIMGQVEIPVGAVEHNDVEVRILLDEPTRSLSSATVVAVIVLIGG
jgi:hypothetical protein